MGTEPKTVWGIADSRDTERWSGAETSREAAIAEGRATYPGKGFWVCSGTVCTPGSFMPDADFLLEDAGQRACDMVGEAAEEWPPEPSVEARDELNAFLEAWADKHLPCGFWTADADPEYVEPALRQFSAFEERHIRCSMLSPTEVYKHDPDCEAPNEDKDSPPIGTEGKP